MLEEELGCKLSECDIKYTPWSNLRKSSDMDVGTIGFHNNKIVGQVDLGKSNAGENLVTGSMEFLYDSMACVKLSTSSEPDGLHLSMIVLFTCFTANSAR